MSDADDDLPAVWPIPEHLTDAPEVQDYAGLMSGLVDYQPQTLRPFNPHPKADGVSKSVNSGPNRDIINRLRDENQTLRTRCSDLESALARQRAFIHTVRRTAPAVAERTEELLSAEQYHGPVWRDHREPGPQLHSWAAVTHP